MNLFNDFILFPLWSYFFLILVIEFYFKVTFVVILQNKYTYSTQAMIITGKRVITENIRGNITCILSYYYLVNWIIRDKPKYET